MKIDKGININFGGGLDGIFKGLESLISLAGNLKEAGEEIKKEGEIDLSNLKEGMKGVYGFSVKTAAGGHTVKEPFGNIKITPKGPKVEKEREPITDVFYEKDHVLAMFEMPGVNSKDIKIELKGDILEVSAGTKDKKYYKEVLLEEKKLKKENLTSNYKNGILEVKIKK
ncbi:MAG: heat-shock protein Hsp20 [Lentisphaerae bacterium GWF2_38_69]|nr:MAG: heat-shock protein Hsp20 [Lentisphaerae bacterium GWF2_38_69]